MNLMETKRDLRYWAGSENEGGGETERFEGEGGCVGKIQSSSSSSPTSGWERFGEERGLERREMPRPFICSSSSSSSAFLLLGCRDRDILSLYISMGMEWGGVAMGRVWLRLCLGWTLVNKVVMGWAKPGLSLA